jgi:hypothetical protein
LYTAQYTLDLDVLETQLSVNTPTRLERELLEEVGFERVGVKGSFFVLAYPKKPLHFQSPPAVKWIFPNY